MTILNLLPLKKPRLLGGGGYAEVYAGEGADGPVVLKLARVQPRAGVNITNGVFFAEGLMRHTGSVGAWTPTPNEVIAAEAQQLRKLKNPAFPRFMAEGETQGRRWLVERYLSGRTWRQAIYVDKDVRPGQVGALAKILAAVQKSGELAFHGDLKPDNLLLDDQGQVRILDPSSGLARVPAPGAPAQQLFTTPLYNPELETSDIASLGLILAEVLWGRDLLLEANENQPQVSLGPKLQAHLRALEAVGTSAWTRHLRRLPRPSLLAPNVPPALEALTLACLGLSWDGRVYEHISKPSLQEFADRLAN